MTSLPLYSTELKKDFPVLQQTMNGKPLIYLDNAATTQKPQAVIDAMTSFYQDSYATVHRGVYRLGHESTAIYDAVRKQVSRFINADSEKEIVYVKGTTEAINLVANSFAGEFLQAGDEILVSEIEHHANFVPWQQVAKRNGLVFRTIPVNDVGELDMTAYESMLSPKTKLVAIGHVSNALGTIHPVKEVVKKAHSVGAKVLIDGAQSVAHMKVDVQDLDCDFYAFSGHKLLGPTGIGVLYAKKELLEAMPPYMLGGDMIETVGLTETTFAPIPEKFEAGTPAFVEVIGLSAAISYIEKIGLEAIEAIEANLLAIATEKLSKIDGLKIIGTAKNKAAVISFVLDNIHPHDIGTILDEYGIAIRAGHHCAQPAMTRYCVPATARASFSFYNTESDIDKLVSGIHAVVEMFA
ncbi:cysteine desulfurase [bacterium]|jgi:cysteine desulfurase / selenocysteine lyase|nr:cysteine desulfurase [bacterium]